MPGVTDITGLGSLTSVSRVSMEQLPKLEKISFLKNLKGAHFSYLSLGNVAALKEMDVTGLTIDELKLSSVPEGLLLKAMTLSREKCQCQVVKECVSKDLRMQRSHWNLQL